MTMFILYADKTQLAVHQREVLTSGCANVCPVRFEFSPEWDGMVKTACFKSGSRTVSVLLNRTGMCTVPWEVTAPDSGGKHLFIGVYGTRNDSVVLPTIWVDCGVILRGVCGGTASGPPTPGLYEQVLTALSEKADGLSLNGRELTLLSGGKPTDCVTLPIPDTSSSLEAATEEEVNELLHEVFDASQNKKEDMEES